VPQSHFDVAAKEKGTVVTKRTTDKIILKTAFVFFIKIPPN
jgi:hypothetical protein